MSSTTGNPLPALASTVYLPAAAYGIGSGTAAPVMTPTALDLDAGVPVAGLTVALVGFGQVLGDLQAGQVVASLGERRSIVLARTVAAVGVLICILAPTVWWLCAGNLTVGLANSVWGLARQNYRWRCRSRGGRGRCRCSVGRCGSGSSSARWSARRRSGSSGCAVDSSCNWSRGRGRRRPHGPTARPGGCAGGADRAQHEAAQTRFRR